MKLMKLLEMKTLIGRIRPSTPKMQKNPCRLPPKDRKMMQISQKEIRIIKTMHKFLQKKGMIISCTKYPETMIEMKVWALEEGIVISGLTLTRTTQKISETKKENFPENGSSFLLSFLFSSSPIGVVWIYNKAFRQSSPSNKKCWIKKPKQKQMTIKKQSKTKE